MHIQWFPGHMTKALRMIDDNLKLVKGIIYVLDARCPISSLNPEFKSRINNKKVLYVLNKGDMIAKEDAKAYCDYFIKEGNFAVCVDSLSPNSARTVLFEIKKMFSEDSKRNAQKGVFKTSKLMVIGIPNCGKSTLINNLCRKKKAQTGNKPGVTKGKQWLNVDGEIELLDTPGTLFPSFPDQPTARKLAYVGSINDDILDLNELALSLISDLKDICPNKIVERFNIKLDSSAIDMLNDICKNRGYILRGGELDMDRCARAIVDEFRKGKLGKIALDKV